MKKVKCGAYFLEAVYSPKDDGWYAEVWCARTGVTFYTTIAYGARSDAIDDAKDWARRHPVPPRVVTSSKGA